MRVCDVCVWRQRVVEPSDMTIKTNLDLVLVTICLFFFFDDDDVVAL